VKPPADQMADGQSGGVATGASVPLGTADQHDTRSLKPTPLRPDFDRMPAELRKRPRWLLWCYELKADAQPDDEKPWTKVPYRADGQGRAASNRDATWCDFEAARDAYLRRVQDADGVGFVTGDGVTGGDVDDCRDPITGELTPEAAAIIAEARTYAEVSPSSTGARFWALTDSAPGKRKRRGSVELYPSGQYLTVTGAQLDDTPDDLKHRTDQLAAIHARYIAAPERPQPAGSAPRGLDVRHEDRDVLEAMWRSDNAPRIRALWEGDTSAHDGDHSAADLALVSHLAWFTNYDEDQADRLFRASGLMRDKWDEARGDLTYGERTLARAFEGHQPGDGYQGRKASRPGGNQSEDATSAGPSHTGEDGDDPRKDSGTIQNGLPTGMSGAYPITEKLKRWHEIRHDRAAQPRPDAGSDGEADQPARDLLPITTDADPEQKAKPRTSKGEPRKPSTPAAVRAPRLTRLSSVAPEAVEHLDDGRLALGKLTLLVGDAGIGKTHIALAIAASVTEGRPIFPPALSPGASPRAPSNVLAFIGEDGLADTIRTRFDDADGDPDRFVALTDVLTTTEDGRVLEGEVDLTQIDVIEMAILELRPSLVIVDPIQVYMGAGVDMHRANEVRATLKGIAKLAAKHRASLLILAHLNKGTGRALYRALGSIDFVAIARSVLVAGVHDGAPALAHAKANLSARAPTLTYTLQGGRLVWTGTTEANADDLISQAPQQYERPREAEAADWLVAYLVNGPRRARDVAVAAKRANIAERTLRRAADTLGVAKRRVGSAAAEGHWVWELPDA